MNSLVFSLDNELHFYFLFLETNNSNGLISHLELGCMFRGSDPMELVRRNGSAIRTAPSLLATRIAQLIRLILIRSVQCCQFGGMWRDSPISAGNLRGEHIWAFKGHQRSKQLFNPFTCLIANSSIKRRK